MTTVQRPPAAPGGRHPSLDRSCVRCGYGVAALRTPDRCPMCGGREWRLLLRRPPSAETRR